MLSYDSQVLASARIGAAGVEKLCRDLQVDPSDRKVRNTKYTLAIAIKLALATLHILLALDSFQAHMTISLQLSEGEQRMRRFFCWLGKWERSKWVSFPDLNLSKVCKSA